MAQNSTELMMQTTPDQDAQRRETAALVPPGTMLAWGSNSAGQLGDGGSGWLGSCAPRAPCGRWVSPTKGVGSLDALALHRRGHGGRRGHRVLAAAKRSAA